MNHFLAVLIESKPVELFQFKNLELSAWCVSLREPNGMCVKKSPVNLTM